MCNDLVITDTPVSAFLKYKSAIKTGLADTAKSYKFKFIDLLFSKLNTECNNCGTTTTCSSGCNKIIERCTPTIEEYIEFKNCIIGECINITDVTQ